MPVWRRTAVRNRSLIVWGTASTAFGLPFQDSLTPAEDKSVQFLHKRVHRDREPREIRNAKAFIGLV